MRIAILRLVSVFTIVAAAGTAATVPQSAQSRRPRVLSDGAEVASIPQMMSYQGKLTDTLGQAVPNGNYQLRFRLYTEATGGAPFWTESQTVGVRDGLFHALLGSVSPILALPDSGALYLGLQVASDPELSPRLRIVSAAYAFVSSVAGNADKLQGKDTSAFVRTAQPGSVTGAMIVDGAVAAADLGQMGADSGQVMKWDGAGWFPADDSAGTADNAWTRGGSDSVLYTVRALGIARGGAENKLWGDSVYTHVNLGVACTTGLADQAYRYATVGGGQANIASNGWSTVCGGYDNVADGSHAIVGGGEANQAVGQNSVIDGGYWNAAGADYAAVSGGSYNGAGGVYSAVLGGYSNHADGTFSAVGGGNTNHATDTGAFVGGGTENAADGSNAAVPGGYANAARGSCAFAAGRYARANHAGSFAWSDSAATESESMYTTGGNQFRVRARGGTWFFSNTAMTSGAYLAPNSNSWESACDSMTKEDFHPVDRQELLARVASLRVRNYKMRDQNDGTRHIGPVAQDFHRAFGYGETETGINLADADGVLLAAVQALYEQNQAQQAEIDALRAELNRR